LIFLLIVRLANVEKLPNPNEPIQKKSVGPLAETNRTNHINANNSVEKLADAMAMSDGLIAQIFATAKQMSEDSNVNMSGAWLAVVVQEGEIARATENYLQLKTIKSKLALISADEQLRKAMARYSRLREQVWRRAQRVLNRVGWLL